MRNNKNQKWKECPKCKGRIYLSRPSIHICGETIVISKMTGNHSIMMCPCDFCCRMRGKILQNQINNLSKSAFLDKFV